MKYDPNSPLQKMIFNNRYSFISLVVILGMYFIATSYYAPQSTLRMGTAAITNNKSGLVGGPFNMTTDTGKAVTEQMLLGKISLLFFGFTHCPDICPTALGKLSAVYNALPERLKPYVQVIFVTLDPERDTEENLHNYMQAFNDTFTALRGTAEQTKSIAKEYAVFYNKGTVDPSGNYMLDHTGYVYMINAKGEYAQHFKHNAKGQEILKQVMIEANKKGAFKQ